MKIRPMISTISLKVFIGGLICSDGPVKVIDDPELKVCFKVILLTYELVVVLRLL